MSVFFYTAASLTPVCLLNPLDLFLQVIDFLRQRIDFD
jgi:hypothetical protein